LKLGIHITYSVIQIMKFFHSIFQNESLIELKGKKKVKIKNGFFGHLMVDQDQNWTGQRQIGTARLEVFSNLD